MFFTFIFKIYVLTEMWCKYMINLLCGDLILTCNTQQIMIRYWASIHELLYIKNQVLPYYKVLVLLEFVSDRPLWVKQTSGNVKKIPSANFMKNTVQILSILNRIKFITAFLPTQYKRKRSQYFWYLFIVVTL